MGGLNGLSSGRNYIRRRGERLSFNDRTGRRGRRTGNGVRGNGDVQSRRHTHDDEPPSVHAAGPAGQNRRQPRSSARESTLTLTRTATVTPEILTEDDATCDDSLDNNYHIIGVVHCLINFEISFSGMVLLAAKDHRLTLACLSRHLSDLHDLAVDPSRPE